MLIIYEKKTGKAVSNDNTNSLYPNGVPNHDDVIKGVVQNFGGLESDYGVFRLHDIKDAETVNKTITHDYTIQNGKIIFGALKRIPEPEPQPPSDTEVMMDYLVDVDYRMTIIELGL